MIKTLPLLDLNLDELCMVQIAWKPSESPIVGQTYAYRFAPLQEAVLSSGDNLDGFLTKQIAAGLYQKKLRKKVLIWYAATSELVFITVTRLGTPGSYDWLRNIPGFFDSGHDHIKMTASPFMHWDGKLAYRLYALPEPDTDEPEKKGEWFVVDFGSLFRLGTGATDRKSYLAIKENNKKYWDYSAVPNESLESTTVGGKEISIHHAFYRLMGETAEELF